MILPESLRQQLNGADKKPHIFIALKMCGLVFNGSENKSEFFYLIILIIFQAVA